MAYHISSFFMWSFNESVHTSDLHNLHLSPYFYCHCPASHQSINQSGVTLYSVGDHDLPLISIPCCFLCFCHSSYFEPLCKSIPHLLMLVSFAVFYLDCSSFFLLITWTKKVSSCSCILFMSVSFL